MENRHAILRVATLKKKLKPSKELDQRMSAYALRFVWPAFTSLRRSRKLECQTCMRAGGFAVGIHLLATFASHELLEPRSKSLASPSKTVRIEREKASVLGARK